MEKLKSPAINFYTSDFMTGTIFMSNEEVGAYIRLLCMQHQKGHLNEKEMLQICLSQEILDSVMTHFKKDEDGLFYNERMDFEKERRNNYVKSRSNNRNKGDSQNTSIYLMIDKLNNIVKIGNSNNPERRLIEVRNYYKNNNIYLYAYCENESQKIEKELHDLYKSKWCYDEWYKLNDDDISYIISTYHMKLHMTNHMINDMSNHMENIIINILNNNKNISKEYILEYYSNNIKNNISSFEYQKLEYYIELFKNDLRIIIYAIEYCKLYKALSINYLCKILYNWEEAGFKTLEDVKNAEKEKPQVEESTKENEELFDYDWLNDNE